MQTAKNYVTIHNHHKIKLVLLALCVIAAIALLATNVRGQCAPDDLICITTP